MFSGSVLTYHKALFVRTWIFFKMWRNIVKAAGRGPHLGECGVNIFFSFVLGFVRLGLGLSSVYLYWI
jgi:hypothetical protein